MAVGIGGRRGGGLHCKFLSRGLDELVRSGGLKPDPSRGRLLLSQLLPCSLPPLLPTLGRGQGQAELAPPSSLGGGRRFRGGVAAGRDDGAQLCFA